MCYSYDHCILWFPMMTFVFPGIFHCLYRSQLGNEFCMISWCLHCSVYIVNGLIKWLSFPFRSRLWFFFLQFLWIPEIGRFYSCFEQCFYLTYPYVMQLSNMILKSVKFNFNFSDWLYTSFAELTFTTDPIEIGQLFLKIWAFWRIAKNNRKQRNCLLIFVNPNSFSLIASHILEMK